MKLSKCNLYTDVTFFLMGFSIFSPIKRFMANVCSCAPTISVLVSNFNFSSFCFIISKNCVNAIVIELFLLQPVCHVGFIHNHNLNE